MLEENKPTVLDVTGRSIEDVSAEVMALVTSAMGAAEPTLGRTLW